MIDKLINHLLDMVNIIISVNKRRIQINDVKTELCVEENEPQSEVKINITSKGGFEYNYNCTAIDFEIETFKSDLDNKIDNYVFLNQLPK